MADVGDLTGAVIQGIMGGLQLRAQTAQQDRQFQVQQQQLELQKQKTDIFVQLQKARLEAAQREAQPAGKRAPGVVKQFAAELTPPEEGASLIDNALRGLERTQQVESLGAQLLPEVFSQRTEFRKQQKDIRTEQRAIGRESRLTREGKSRQRLQEAQTESLISQRAFNKEEKKRKRKVDSLIKRAQRLEKRINDIGKQEKFLSKLEEPEFLPPPVAANRNQLANELRGIRQQLRIETAGEDQAVPSLETLENFFGASE